LNVWWFPEKQAKRYLPPPATRAVRLHVIGLVDIGDIGGIMLLLMFMVAKFNINHLFVRGYTDVGGFLLLMGHRRAGQLLFARMLSLRML
jgi:hypothetical protein